MRVYLLTEEQLGQPYEGLTQQDAIAAAVAAQGVGPPADRLRRPADAGAEDRRDVRGSMFRGSRNRAACPVSCRTAEQNVSK
jgi:hypothetical protein